MFKSSLFHLDTGVYYIGAHSNLCLQILILVLVSTSIDTRLNYDCNIGMDLPTNSTLYVYHVQYGHFGGNSNVRRQYLCSNT